MHRRGFLRSLLTAPVALYAALRTPTAAPVLLDSQAGLAVRPVTAWPPQPDLFNPSADIARLYHTGQLGPITDWCDVSGNGRHWHLEAKQTRALADALAGRAEVIDAPLWTARNI